MLLIIINNTMILILQVLDFDPSLNNLEENGNDNG